MKRKYYMLMIMLAGTCTLHAQQITYNHDADKMNQITVMEIGSGSLTPQYFYTVFHNSYRRSAARTNKLAYRTEAGLAGYKQVPMSDSIQEAMTKRAEIEALNIADRSGGAADVAWMAEGDKIKNKLDSYERNIGRIIGAGGNRDNQERWKERLNQFRTAIKATQDAYMPNAERKKQYLAIYADICRENQILIEYVVQLNNANRNNRMMNAELVLHDPRAQAAKAALNRWREAGWSSARK
jgi:hypothetical protein